MPNSTKTIPENEEGARKMRPLIVNAAEARVLQNGATQLWRAMAPQPDHAQIHEWSGNVLYDGESRRWCWKNTVGGLWEEPSAALAAACPYGKPGDLLWVREAWADNPQWDCGVQPLADVPKFVYKADFPTGSPDGTHDTLEPWGVWNSPVSMPKGVSRRTLEIVEVRVKKLGDITSFEAEDTGINLWAFPGDHRQGNETQFQACFRLWWGSVYGCWNPREWAWAMKVREVPNVH